MSIRFDDIEAYHVALKAKIHDLLVAHQGPMLTTWLVTQGYVDIHKIYEEELGKVHRSGWHNTTIDKLWITMKNLVFAIQAYVLIHEQAKLLEFVDNMIDFQISSFCADFEELVDAKAIHGLMHH